LRKNEDVNIEGYVSLIIGQPLLRSSCNRAFSEFMACFSATGFTVDNYIIPPRTLLEKLEKDLSDSSGTTKFNIYYVGMTGADL
jgi:hypothetical protein